MKKLNPIQLAQCQLAYQNMLTVRILDQKATNLQRTGKMSTYPSAKGQEAIGTALGLCMRPTDIFAPYYRDQACLMLRGLQPLSWLAFWGGYKKAALNPCSHPDLPISIPIASHLPHAVGAAYACQYQQTDKVVVASCGDGATSKGDFYEALNTAAVLKVPVVFIINNNQWAISTPLASQSATPNLANKFSNIGLGLTLSLDGNDILAMLDGIGQALDYARTHQAPVLIEANTYRLDNHTTVDDASKYMDAAKLAQAQQYDPLPLTKKLLQKSGINESKFALWEQQITTTINTAAKDYLALPIAPTTTIVESLFANLPDQILTQYEDLIDGN